VEGENHEHARARNRTSDRVQSVDRLPSYKGDVSCGFKHFFIRDSCRVINAKTDN